MLYTKAYIKQIDEEERRIKGVASTETVDRAGDIVNVDGWVLQNFLKNPVLPFAHDYFRIPVGRVEKIAVEETDNGKALVFEAKMGSEKANPFAEQVWHSIQEGLLNAFSVGFQPLEFDPQDAHRITKQDLLEISVVPVPANPEAVVMNQLQDRMKKEIRDVINGKIEETKKSVVEFEAWPKADKDREWDANAAEERIRRWASSDGSGEKDTIDWAKYRKAFAWYDAENEEEFGSYKLPHHDVVAGELKTVWRGTVAAMSALLGARGGVDIPEDEKEAVHEHLSKHYEQFDEEPPELQDAEKSEAQKLFEDLVEKHGEDYALRELRKLDEERPEGQKGRSLEAQTLLRFLNELKDMDRINERVIRELKKTLNSEQEYE